MPDASPVMWANRGAVLGGLAAATGVRALAVPPGAGAETTYTTADSDPGPAPDITEVPLARAAGRVSFDGRHITRAAVAAALLLTASSAAAGPGVTFMGRDAVGDSGAAPDIVTATIQQADSLATTILFRVELGNRASLGGEDVVAFAIDSDNNDATGPDGDDYAIVLRPGGATQLGRWNGSSYAPTASASLKALDRFGVSVARVELGNGDALGVSFLTFGPGESSDSTGELPFFVLYPECANRKDDDKDGLLDAADRGCSSVEDEDESDEPVTMRAGKVASKPLRAGKVASVSVPVTVAETGVRIAGGTATCAVRRKVGSRMPASAGLAGGRATCRFTVPAAARGQSVTGSITVVWRGKRLVVRFVGRVA